MKITRQTDSEIVVADSSLAANVVLGILFLVLFALGLALRWYIIACISAPALLLTVFRLRHSTVVLNAATHSIHWTRLHITRKETGSLEFPDVQDVVLVSRHPAHPARQFRLSVRTATADLPVSIGYSVRKDQAATIRATLLDFIRASAAPKPASAASAANTDAIRTQQLNDSICSLLRQGRKVDAILLVQQSDHLDLAEATFRVNQVASRMETKQPAT
jgi:hypothetical protein